MQNKGINFSGMNVYAGIDVHKKSWSVTILAGDIEHKTFNQPPSAEQLAKYMQKNFPGASYHSAYEAGFSGYGHHRSLVKLGVNNIIINAADVPTTSKEKTSKTDKVDSRKIAKGLRNGDLRGIHIFDESHQDLRSFARMRHIMQRDLRRSKQRIKMFLLFNTIPIPLEYDNEHWSKGFEAWLKGVKFPTAQGRRALDFLVNNYDFQKNEVRQITKELKAYFRKHYKRDYYLLRSIPGIGPLTSIAILTEIGDIRRFPSIRQLSSFAGLLPMMSSSGESERVGGLTYRCNPYLRVMLVEASWQAIRSDPAMLHYYNGHVGKKVNGKKAIIKVARKLLNRIRYVLINQQPYVKGVVK